MGVCSASALLAIVEMCDMSFSFFLILSYSFFDFAVHGRRSAAVIFGEAQDLI